LHKSKTSNRNPLSIRARVETCISVTTAKPAQCRLKESVFHLMPQNNVALNIRQNCQTISGL